MWERFLWQFEWDEFAWYLLPFEEKYKYLGPDMASSYYCCSNVMIDKWTGLSKKYSIEVVNSLNVYRQILRFLKYSKHITFF